MKVFALVDEWVEDCESGRSVMLYKNEDRAIVAFDSAVKDEKTDGIASRFINDKDCDGLYVEELNEECCLRSYVFYTDGGYAEMHTSITLEEVTVIE